MVDEVVVVVVVLAECRRNAMSRHDLLRRMSGMKMQLRRKRRATVPPIAPPMIAAVEWEPLTPEEGVVSRGVGVADMAIMVDEAVGEMERRVLMVVDVEAESKIVLAIVMV